MAALLPAGRGAGDAEHLPGGLRDGRRRGRGLPGRCRSRRATPGCSRSRAQLAAALPPEVAELTSFPVELGAVEAIADRLDALAGPARGRAASAAREALVETVGRLWSWEGVARGVLAASAGELEDLPRAGGS